MKLLYKDHLFYLISEIKEKEIAKEAGFRWSSKLKKWWTYDPARVEKILLNLDNRQEIEDMLPKIVVDRDEQKKIIGSREKQGQAAFRELMPYFEYVFHCENNHIRVYAPYESTYKSILYETFNAKWDKELQCRTIDKKMITKVYEWARENGFAVSSEFLIEKERLEKEKKEKIGESKAVDSKIEIPVNKGLSYYPFQKAGIEFMVAKKGCALISDQPGLGKTIETAGFFNYMGLDNIKPVLIICPASMKWIWQQELQKWLVQKARIQILSGQTVKEKLWGEIVIANYDIIKYHLPFLLEYKFKTLTADESHNIKSHKALRTKAIMELAKDIPYRICLTGTPFLNRPVEGWTTLNLLRPDIFNNFWDYARRYCNLQNNRFGLDLNGASNLDELQEVLRTTVMLRRLKKDVLSELPDKTTTLIPIDIENQSIFGDTTALINNMKEVLNKKKGIETISDVEEKKKKFDELQGKYSDILSRIEELKQEAARRKLPFAQDFIDNIISDQKVVVFVHHKFMVENLKNYYGDKAVVLCGDTPDDERPEVVRKFTEDPNIRVFIGSMRAAGYGITLTAASIVVFLEFDWTPAIHLQSADRCHRIGTKNAVNVYYLALNDSIDIEIARTLERKQAILNAIMDDSECERISNLSIFEEIIDEFIKDHDHQGIQRKS